MKFECVFLQTVTHTRTRTHHFIAFIVSRLRPILALKNSRLIGCSVTNRCAYGKFIFSRKFIV